ncbi:L,D-transpeptidase [Arcobacter vandammei]|uniref:L,D-transpeptidase n=1 Tax=Arcobacter vandammei TaxID=2782243 RepID=UPI0018E0294E|nr:L,D-transpeptidase [Arcobacter vandammei]
MRRIIAIFIIFTYFLYSNEEFPIVSTMPPYEELEFVSYDYFPKQNNQNIIKKEEARNFKQEEKKYIENNQNNEQKLETKVQEKVMNNEEIFVKKVDSVSKKVEVYFKEPVEEELSEEIKVDLRDTSFREFDENEKKYKDSDALLKALSIGNPKNYELTNKNLENYEELIIEVDSNKNIMRVKSKVGKNISEIKTYTVSTAKTGIKKPLGEGRISAVSLNPVWYPTNDTRRSFEKRGIILPTVVPANHKYNYMGAAKLNLTHIVDGNQTYRIHGTLNEKTIGSKESAGCIRMKNSDVLELAKMVQNFFDTNGASKVKVILL